MYDADDERDNYDGLDFNDRLRVRADPLRVSILRPARPGFADLPPRVRAV
jgi:hypothetical protein